MNVEEELTEMVRNIFQNLVNQLEKKDLNSISVEDLKKIIKDL